jgi:hypothetical protein
MSVPAPLPQGEMSCISGEWLFLTAGFEACCGHPLPDGSLPVGGKGLKGSIFLIAPAEWQAYRAKCEGERAANPEFTAAA